MSIYVVTGKLGNGKTLSAVGRIQHYLRQGRRVATNLDLFMEHWPNPRKKGLSVVRLPDKPSYADMCNLGPAYEGPYSEDKFGLIVLDECGTWFNSRNWNDPGRKELNDWFLHSRKLGWDVIFIIQSIEILDKQARDTLAEHTVFCRRLDNIKIPYLGALTRFVFGKSVGLPRVHMGVVKYGTSTQSLTVERWFYRGSELYKFYDTRQVFLEDSGGMRSLLTPWHLVGRYLPPINYWSLVVWPFVIILKSSCWIVAMVAAAVTGRSPATVAAMWSRRGLNRRSFRRSSFHRLLAKAGM